MLIIATNHSVHCAVSSAKNPAGPLLCWLKQSTVSDKVSTGKLSDAVIQAERGISRIS
jgi:hypothetical protein